MKFVAGEGGLIEQAQEGMIDIFFESIHGLIEPFFNATVDGLYSVLPDTGGLLTMVFGILIMSTGNVGKWSTYYLISICALIGLIWMGGNQL